MRECYGKSRLFTDGQAAELPDRRGRRLSSGALQLFSIAVGESERYQLGRILPGAGGCPGAGTFPGKHIEKGKGVCGTAWETDSTQLVANVHEFPGHIACDSASNSEVVVPVRRDGEVVAVIDIDSPMFGRFSSEDAEGLEKIADLLGSRVVWPE